MPNEIGQLTPEDREILDEWISTRQRNCDACGQRNWMPAQQLMTMLPVTPEMTRVHEGEALGFVAVICVTCGLTSFLSARVVGIL